MRQISKKGKSFFVNHSEEFWDSFEDNTWEPETINILDNYLSPEDTFIDIGAWIGPITLYAGLKVKKCYSFEPDHAAFKELKENVNLNPSLAQKIDLQNQAITTDGKNVKIYSRYSYGDSGTSILKRVKSKNEFKEVSSTTFNKFISSNSIQVDFIKMDVEGAEFFILPSMMEVLKNQKPKLLLSLHHGALTEFNEINYFPFGGLRRIYRFFDKERKFLKSKSSATMRQLINSLSFYDNCYTGGLNKFSASEASDQELENLEMLLFF
jgi:FkbM family methyltransferase